MRISRLSSVVIAVTLTLACPLAWATGQARILGTVVGTDGKPVVNAVITLTTDELTTFSKTVEVRPDGSFSTLILDATKTYKLEIKAPGYLPVIQLVNVPVGTMNNRFDFILPTEAELVEADRVALLERPGYKEYNEGRTMLEQCKTAEAKALFEAAVAAVPDLLPAWSSLADIAYEAGDFENALAHSRTCLELDDEALRCLAIAANAAKEMGDVEAHKAYLDRYQEANPEDPAVLFNQAVEFLNKLDDEHAGPLLEQCLELDPDFEKCLFEYGMLLLRSGDMEGAKARLQRLIEVAPDSDNAATARETIKYL